MQSSWLLESKEAPNLKMAASPKCVNGEESGFVSHSLCESCFHWEKAVLFLLSLHTEQQCSQISFRRWREIGEKQSMHFPAIWLAPYFLKNGLDHFIFPQNPTLSIYKDRMTKTEINWGLSAHTQKDTSPK